MLQDSVTLGNFLGAQANRRGLRLAHDTHFDAGNWELRWWKGKALHRLDFHPLHNGTLAITHYTDHFTFFPRITRWAHDQIPMFPYPAHIEWERVGTLQFPLAERDVSKYLDRSTAAEPAAANSDQL